MEYLDNTYGAIERQLRDQNFDVKHLMRDARGDWGDDGGYLVSISEKNNKVYLHIIEVNYNFTTSSNVLEETDMIKPQARPDFIICNSIEEAQEQINMFVGYLDKACELIENQDYYFEGRYIDKNLEIPDGFKHLELFYLEMVAKCWFAYSEYTQDKELLLNLSKTPYMADYSLPY